MNAKPHPAPLADAPPASKRQFLPPVALFLALALFFGVSAAIEIRRYPVPLPAALAIFFCLLLLIALVLAPAFQPLRAILSARFRGPTGAVAATVLFLLPYTLYASGAGDFTWRAFGTLAAVAAGPFFVFSLAPVERRERLNWQDLLVLAWIITPVLARWIRGLWNVPVNLDFMARLFVLAAGAWAFLIFRGTANAGYEARIDRRILRHGLLNFGLFAVIGLPLALALHFVAWKPHWRGPWQFTFDLVTIFVFIAVPEELYFRGILQNLLEGTWQSRYGAQAAAAVLFGFTHILHGFPNWPYVLLASIAGWFYGSAWRSTHSLAASALAHALVDTVWRTWFAV